MRDRRSAPFRTLWIAIALLLPPLAVAQEDSLPGVDLSSLDSTQRAEAMKIFRENQCNCSCGMTIVKCRTDDASCTRSPALARQVVQLLGQGKPSAEVVRTVFKPAPSAAPQPGAGGAKNLVFDVPVGDSYAVGPANAPVTLVTWLDYQ